jgi:predicted phage tail protein
VQQVSLEWPESIDNLSGIFTYLLYASSEGVPDSNNSTLIYQGLTPAFTHTNLMPGRTLYYLVYAVDGAGNYSNPAYAQAVPQSGKSAALPFLFLLLWD